MGRVQGRFFNNSFDLKRMDRDIHQEQAGHGTTVLWYFYLGAVSDETYDEGGRRWKVPPKVMPVVSAVPTQGANVPSDSGRYITDSIELRMSYRQISDEGIGPNLSVDFEPHYSDRFIYRGHVYSIREIHSDGHFDALNRDVMVRIVGGQLRPDELVNDVDFLDYASQ